MVCAALKVWPKFAQFLVCNPCQFFQSSTILVELFLYHGFSLWCFFYSFNSVLFSAFLQGEFEASYILEIKIYR